MGKKREKIKRNRGHSPRARFWIYMEINSPTLVLFLNWIGPSCFSLGVGGLGLQHPIPQPAILGSYREALG